MPRPQKRGLDYFPLECGIFSTNSDLKPLIRRFGSEGIAIALHIFCDVYAQGYYLKPNDLQDYYYELADDCKVSVDKVQLVIAFMADRTLLDAFSLNKNTVITSHGIQRRYVEIMKSRKYTAEQVKGDFWLLDSENEVHPDKSQPDENKSEKNPDKSEKNPDKSSKNYYKENKIKENISLSNNSAGACVREKGAELEAFLKAHGNIVVDNCSSVDLQNIDYKILSDEMEKSGYLRSQKTLSWLARNYQKIKIGTYRDFAKAVPKQTLGGIGNLYRKYKAEEETNES